MNCCWYDPYSVRDRSPCLPMQETGQIESGERHGVAISLSLHHKADRDKSLASGLESQESVPGFVFACSRGLKEV
jgi:hypothetical protein